MSNLDIFDNFIPAVVDRFEGDFVVLKIYDNQELIWPLNKLPEGVAEGDAIKLVFLTNKLETISREELAKTILKEILKTDEPRE